MAKSQINKNAELYKDLSHFFKITCLKNVMSGEINIYLILKVAVADKETPSLFHVQPCRAELIY